MKFLGRNATAARQRVEPRSVTTAPSSSPPDREPLLDEEAGIQNTPRYWPVRPVWLELIWMALAVTLVAIFNLITFLPFTLFSIMNAGHNLLMRMNYRNTPWRRSPESIRVAIIGAGWGGLQVAARLVEHGVAVEIFEARDGVGGTWHQDQRPEGLRLHTPSWAAAFAGFPPHEPEDPDFRPSGEAVRDYIRRFAERTLQDAIQMSSQVTQVSYSTHTRTATLGVRDHTGHVQERGPFDLVVHTGLASEPHLPQLPAQSEFSGQSVHSSGMSREFLDGLLEHTDRRVVVVGGSKSACDAIVALSDAGISPDRVTWLYRRPYQFCKVERFFHDRSWGSRLRGYLAYTSLKMGVFGWFILWLLDYGWSYQTDPWSVPLWRQPGALLQLVSDWEQFHFGMLDARERVILRSHPVKLQGNPARFEADGLLLEDGSRVPADVVIWATGYRTGIERICFSRDGKEIPNERVAARPVFEHAVVPTLPVLVIAHTFFCALGPMRGHSLADYALYHTCVRPPLTEQTMVAAAEAHRCKQTPAQHLLFRPGFWVNLPKLYNDLVDRMVLSTAAPERHIFGLIVSARLSPLEMQLLPRDPEHEPEWSDRIAGTREWAQLGRMLGDVVES